MKDMKENKIENFTQSQELALKDLSKWLNEPVKKDNIDSRVYLLLGKAGTGKTTIVKYILESKLKNDEGTSRDIDVNDMFNTPSVMGVTMSHKAKSVLKKSIHQVCTFAKCFGLKIKYDNDGNTLFERDKYSKYTNVCELPIEVFVHDEVSMYDMTMMNYVVNLTNSTSKIILMGDPGQLPPVNSEGDMDSPAFSMFKNVSVLKERVRQTEGNPIVQLSDVIYDQIFTNQNMKPVYEALKNDKLIDGKGHRSVLYSDFLSTYCDVSEDYMQSKVIAYRNDKVNTFNKVARNKIYDNPVKEYIVGELIYMNDTFFQEKTSVNHPYMLHNSDEYKIVDIVPSQIDSVKVDLLYVDKRGHMHLADIKDPYIPVVNPEGMSKYNNILYWRKKNALDARGYDRASKWAYYYEFKNKFANISYAYCYTAYKAQGSGFKNIFVDVNDIVTVGPLSDKRKLQALYTSITRATDNLYLLKAR